MAPHRSCVVGQCKPCLLQTSELARFHLHFVTVVVVAVVVDDGDGDAGGGGSLLFVGCCLLLVVVVVVFVVVVVVVFCCLLFVVVCCRLFFYCCGCGKCCAYRHIRETRACHISSCRRSFQMLQR